MTSSTAIHPPAALPPQRPVRGLGPRVAVGAIALVAAPGALLAILAATGPGVLLLGLLYPFTLWALISRMRRPLDSVRVVLAVIAAAMSGAGAWVGMALVGVMAEIVPFMGDGEYPHADAWGVLSATIGVVTGVAVLILGLVGRRG